MLLALGKSRSSVEDLKDEADSEKVELRRGLRVGPESAKVEARFKGRWRRGERLERAALLATLVTCVVIGGLIVLSFCAIAVKRAGLLWKECGYCVYSTWQPVQRDDELHDYM